MRTCPKCESKEVAIMSKRGFRIAVCDECNHEWNPKRITHGAG